MSKVLLVTGSYPPDVCGVGDYSAELLGALQHEGVEATSYYRRDWRAATLWGHFARLRGAADVLVMQHPTQGYSGRVSPYILCALPLAARKIVTLHEYSRKGAAGKLLAYLFFLFAEHIVFTAEAERDAACRAAPWIRRKSSVVPIGSNIPVHEPEPPRIDIGYFGLIRPGKGLEEFVHVLRAIGGRAATLRIALIGQTVPGFEAFTEETFQALHAMGVELILNRDGEEVAALLCGVNVAVLPFPDGVTRRRGSALAAMGNGALLVTTRPEHEADFFEGLCVMRQDIPALAAAALDALDRPQAYTAVREAGMAYARSLSWSSIAQSYHGIFSRIERRAA
jgi:glycosyltransferase involved in cell wall biosynthesis